MYMIGLDILEGNATIGWWEWEKNKCDIYLTVVSWSSYKLCVEMVFSGGLKIIDDWILDGMGV